MTNTPVNAAPVRPYDVESKIKLSIKHEKDKPYVITTSGLKALGYPDLRLSVDKGMYVATACHILNDVARHLVVTGRFVKDGMFVKLNETTTIRLKKTEVGGLPLLDVEDGSYEDPRMI